MIRKSTLMLVQSAVLMAIMLIFHITGIGYIKFPIFSFTIMAVPMIVGGVAVGRPTGMLLGALFGMTTMMLPETQLFMSINPLQTMVICIGVRILLGYLCGMFFEVFGRFDKRRVWSIAVTGLLVSILNTVLILGGIAVVFGGDTEVLAAFGLESVTRFQVFSILFIGSLVPAAAEAGICMLLGGAVAKAVLVLNEKMN